MGNRQSYAKFQENLFRSNEIISVFCPPLFPKQPITICNFQDSQQKYRLGTVSNRLRVSVVGEG